MVLTNNTLNQLLMSHKIWKCALIGCVISNLAPSLARFGHNKSSSGWISIYQIQCIPKDFYE
jgi:hypothetical protein